MQGTVWGSLFCTATMDKLGKLKYANEDMMFKYKGEVNVPALEMVDDIVDIQKCGTDAVKANAVVNLFIEHKKVTLSLAKCHKIHCGKNDLYCPQLKVHNKNMHEAEEEKYLGDQVNKYAKHASTVSKRRAKGFGIISDISQILDVIPAGKRRIKMGLHLRQAWFINSLCVNVEVWHNVLKKDITPFLDLDKYLMKKILGVHSKVPVELVYLETAAIPINYVLAGRRINYLHNILTRADHELVKRVFKAQQHAPNKGDWCEFLKEDIKIINFKICEAEMSSFTSKEMKQIVKRCVKSAAFSQLQDIQSSHTKIRDIKYEGFKIQSYIQSDNFSSEEVSALFNLRASTVNGYKMCFPNVYKNDKLCQLGCSEEDSLSHSFSCPKINLHIEHSDITWNAIFASI